MPVYSKSIRKSERVPSFHSMYKSRYYYNTIAKFLSALAVIQVIFGVLFAIYYGWFYQAQFSFFYFVSILNGAFIMAGVLWGIAEIAENSMPDWRRKQLYQASLKKRAAHEQWQKVEWDEE